MGMSEKINNQERLVVEVKILSGNHAFGLSNRELAKLTGTSEANVCRDLAVLEKHGWMERSQPDGRVRLSPAFGKLANEMMKGFQKAKLRLTEEEARYASEMQ
jgi:DNA-binding IclR family transcriptional regulator